MQLFDQDYEPVYHDLVPEAQHPEEFILRLVGTGEKCENEGWVISGSCTKCGHKVELTKATCGRVECPKCYRTWANRAAQRAGARVWGYYETRVTNHVPRHITFELTDVNWDEAKKKAKALGATGGLIVIHPWRIKKEYQDAANDWASRHKGNRYDYVRAQPDPMALLDFSPHAHCLCYGKLVEIKAGDSEYLYRNIRRLGTLEACEGVAFYLLSHTNSPATERAQSVRYFGCCSTQRLKPEWTGKVTVSFLCPECGAPMVETGTCEEITTKHYVATGWAVVIPDKRPAGAKIETVARSRCSKSVLQLPDPRVTPGMLRAASLKQRERRPCASQADISADWCCCHELD
jgi:predicted RNA-binding Zn-ribbon protein involved in translation (DUF1610 family)